MSEMIEVRVTRSFEHPLGRFTRGRFYQVDVKNPMVKGLIEAGYFKMTKPVTVEVPDVVDLAGADEFLGSGVGTRRTRPKKKEKEQGDLTDGQGEAEPGAD